MTIVKLKGFRQQALMAVNSSDAGYYKAQEPNALEMKTFGTGTLMTMKNHTQHRR